MAKSNELSTIYFLFPYKILLRLSEGKKEPFFHLLEKKNKYRINIGFVMS